MGDWGSPERDGEGGEEEEGLVFQYSSSWIVYILLFMVRILTCGLYILGHLSVFLDFSSSLYIAKPHSVGLLVVNLLTN